MKTFKTSILIIGLAAASSLVGCISFGGDDDEVRRTTTTTTTGPSVLAPATVERTTVVHEDD